jgi:hypothetical protein
LEDHDNRLEYFEGYFASAKMPIPIPHAWLSLNGKVVDLTARALWKRYESDYLGISVPRRIIHSHLSRTGFWGPVTEGPFGPRLFGL